MIEENPLPMKKEQGTAKVFVFPCLVLVQATWRRSLASGRSNETFGTLKVSPRENQVIEPFLKAGLTNDQGFLGGAA